MDAATNQLRAFLGNSLASHVDDLQLLIDLCRAIERVVSGVKFDKKACACMVLKGLFPSMLNDEASLLKLSNQIDVLHSYGIFERKAISHRVYSSCFSSKKK